MGLSFRNLFFADKHLFPEDRQQAHEDHHREMSWIYYCSLILGFWLIASPPTFGYTVPAMIWSDVLSGLIAIFLSYFALKPYNLWAQWGLLFVGIWLLIAPMIFWAEAGAGLLTDFFTGTLLVFLAIILPGQPGIKLYAPEGPAVPGGWSYNPSAWNQRIPVILLAWIGFFISRYMGAFQLEFIETVWDPFFGEGTRRVLDSDVSHSFPVSDATLGAFAYLMDILFGAAGGVHRWRTMPWVVMIFGILIIPLGIVSITLIILQPLMVGYWCTFCLTSAMVSLIMIPFAIDEVLATIQVMIYEKRENGTSYWTTFWFGGTMEGGDVPSKEDPTTLLPHTFKGMYKDMLHIPWNLWLLMFTGMWVMASPGALEFSGTLAYSNQLTGAVAVSFAIISMSEVTRALRYADILLGLWVALSPWIFASPPVAVWSGVIAGILLMLLSFPRGSIEGRRGNFDQYIK